MLFFIEIDTAYCELIKTWSNGKSLGLIMIGNITTVILWLLHYYNCNSEFTIVVSIVYYKCQQITAWIRRVAAFNDADLSEELRLINKNSFNAFTRAISRTRRPELDSHIHRNGAYEAHPHADTINLLLSIGESTLSAINSEIPVSPVPYAVSPYMYVTARIKILT
ncbi:hypothetical protein QVD99_008578 [Batrachochytrium dendrobatidis]|nr:hypothetical protein QVD99_008578 [Batrachochytrium dendrobatidis]